METVSVVTPLESNGRWRKDRLTPYKISLLALANVYIDSFSALRYSFTKWSFTDDQERCYLLTWFDLLQGEDTELANVLARLEKVGKHEIIDTLVKRLKELRMGIHSLMDLFSEFDDDILFIDLRPLLTSSSLVGIFIRRMKLQFAKLSFEAVTQLYETFCVYYDVCFPKKIGQLSHLRECGLENNSYSRCDEETYEVIKKFDVQESSTCRQTEFFLAQQAHLLEFNELEALPPIKLQQKVHEILAQNPDLAEAHYVTYLNSQRLCDYSWSIDSLHHYFDRQQRSGNKPDGEASVFGFSYAALNLAALHYRFGNWKVARAAVREAICTAQENGDTFCLQHALGWIQRLDMEGSEDAEFLLQRLTSKSTELNLHMLASSGMLAAVQHMARNATRPSVVMERLSSSDSLNCQHSLTHLTAVSYAQRSALWAMYGRKELCSLNAQLVLHMNMRERGACHAGEPECMSLCQLAILYSEQGDFNMMGFIFDYLRQHFCLPLKLSAAWQLTEQQLLFDMALHRWQWQKAEQAINCIAAFDVNEAVYRSCLLSKEKGEIFKASQKLDELLQKINSTEADKTKYFKEFNVRLLLLKSELDCSSGRPETACDTLTRSLTYCRQDHLEYFEALALARIAFMQQQLGLHSRALRIIGSVMVRLLSHGNLLDRARVHLLWAKCQVAAGTWHSLLARQRSLLSAIQAVTEVIAMYNKLQAKYRLKEALYYQARLHHELGHSEQRNSCARQFKELDILYPTVNVALVRMF